jgi:hypothetical protein
MSTPEDNDELRPEYDFSKGVRGKYAQQYAEGANIVVLEPDVAEAFKTSEEVNAALRKVLRERADKHGAA